jgi:hypothetical protein
MGTTYLKNLTAYVVEDTKNDCATITIKNDNEALVLEVTHRALSTKNDKTLAINEHLFQLITRGLNITKIETNMTGIQLP